jgi:hypothetical protein
MSITVTYRSIDGFKKVGTFKTLDGARAFAAKWVGSDAEIGSTYAVASDGIGKVTVQGCTLAELFAPKVDLSDLDCANDEFYAELKAAEEADLIASSFDPFPYGLPF